MPRQVTDYLSGINDYIFLPGLQREFVWSPDQIEDLFDSLIRGYPIGIITEWQVRSGQVADYNSYHFLEKYIATNHKPPAAVREAGFAKYNKQTEGEEPEVLIIDGQQRLNSLWIGVCGKITQYNGGPGYPRDDPNNWESYQLCIDLFGHPEFSREDTAGDYNFKFRSIGELGGVDNRGYTVEGESYHLWMPVGRLWINAAGSNNETNRTVQRSEMREIVDEYVDEAPIPVDQNTLDDLRDIAKTSARDLRSEVLKSGLNTDKTDKNRSEIPEIFQRLNMEGSDPKPYQLFMSRLMSYWPYADDEDLRINPREEIQNWIDQFQEKYPEYEQDIDRQLFLRYSAYLIGTDVLNSNIRNITEEDMDELRDQWLADGPITMGTQFEWFRKSLEKAFETIIETGIRRQVMNTMPVFALLGAFYYWNPKAEVSDENQNSVFQFLSKGMLLNQSYRVLTHGKCRNWMRYLRDWEPQQDADKPIFPGDELFDTENLSPSPDDIRRAVKNTRYTGEIGEPIFTDKNAVAVLGLIEESYANSKTRDISDYQVDHIYPASRMSEIQTETADDIDVHQIGNLQLLPDQMNNKKDDSWPNDWLNDLGEGEAGRIKRINLYPDVDPKVQNASEFIEKRQEKLIDYLIDKYVK